MHDFVIKWGKELYYRDPNFREEIGKILKSYTSSIRKEIAKQFIALASTDPNEMNAAFEQCKSVLDLKDGIKQFDVFATLDEKVRENSAE
jgi:hypothetical protein